MSRSQLLVGLSTLVLGVLFFVGSFQLSSDAGYGGVGPNFLPLLVGSMLSLCGLFLLWEVRRGGFRNMEEPSGATQGDWQGFAWVTAGILANAFLITTLGFILSCALCFALAGQGFRRSQPSGGGLKSLGKDLVLGMVIAAPVFWMFTQLLAINLPGLTQTGWL
ncbi:MAG: tripartite tricarboxylate transporter TctB family protein [Rhizobacter sp.]